MSDPAGWYPDPTTHHELRYWDGYTWLDDVSDQGATAKDALGGTPLPAPSEAAAKALAAPPAGGASSKKPLYFVVAGVVAVAVIVVAFLVLRGGDDDHTTVLGDKQLTFEDEGKDATHPAVHTVRLKGNQVVLINVTSHDEKLSPGVIVEASQNVVDALNSSIEGISSDLSNKLKDACQNLREEDIGAKGNVAYFFAGTGDPKTDLVSFTVAPIGGDFEIVPVLVDSDGQCKAGKLTLTVQAKPLDFSSVKNRDDLESVLSNDSDLEKFFSSSS